MEVTEVAAVSAGRMFRAGLIHLLIGATWTISPVVGFFQDRLVQDAGAAKADPWIIAIVAILWPFGVPILLRGLALLQQSFRPNAYFRASPAGIELRLGGPSLYGRLIGRLPQFRVLPANPDTFPIRFPADGARLDGRSYVFTFPWQAVASFDVSLFAFVIEMRSGARLLLRRFYFMEGPVMIARRLAEITQILRATHPLPSE
jgi:hypothetical protein